MHKKISGINNGDHKITGIIWDAYPSRVGITYTYIHGRLAFNFEIPSAVKR